MKIWISIGICLPTGLHMNDDDLCDFLHMVVMKCQNILTANVPPYLCRNSAEKEATQSEMIDAIDSLVIARFEQLQNYRRKQFNLLCTTDRCLECQVLEVTDLADVKDIGMSLPTLFRFRGCATMENLRNDLGTKLHQIQHPFLNMVLNNLEILTLPKLILPLFRWHSTLVSIGSYKIRKVECSENEY